MAANTCAVCSLPSERLAALERAIVEGRAYRALAEEYGPSKWTIMRHARTCLPAELAATVAAERLLSRDELLMWMQENAEQLEAVAERCKTAGKFGEEVRARDALVRAHLALARVRHELPAPTGGDVTLTLINARTDSLYERLSPLLPEDVRERVALALEAGAQAADVLTSGNGVHAP